MVDMKTINEVADWMQDRWETKPMPQHTRVAWFKELERRDAEELWSALECHKADEWPPKLPQVLRTLREIANAYKDLPALPMNTVSLPEWLEANGFDSVEDAMRSLSS